MNDYQEILIASSEKLRQLVDLQRKTDEVQRRINQRRAEIEAQRTNQAETPES